MESVLFYLTVISGDCLLVGSTKGRKVEVGASDVDIAISDTLKYTKDIAKKYYLKVMAYSRSYYTLTAVVVRRSSSSNTSLARVPLPLTEGVAQLFSTDDQADLQFYINLNRKKDFYVQTSANKGDVSFEVKPSKLFSPLPKTVWSSEDG